MSQKPKFPEELKQEIMNWKTGNYKEFPIKKISDINKAFKQGKIFIFSWNDNFQKSARNSLIGTICYALICLFFMVLSIELGLIFISFALAPLLLSIYYLKQHKIMKDIGIVAIGPRGVYYQTSPKGPKFFKWNEVKAPGPRSEVGYMRKSANPQHLKTFWEYFYYFYDDHLEKISYYYLKSSEIKNWEDFCNLQQFYYTSATGRKHVSTGTWK